MKNATKKVRNGIIIIVAIFILFIPFRIYYNYFDDPQINDIVSVKLSHIGDTTLKNYDDPKICLQSVEKERKRRNLAMIQRLSLIFQENRAETEYLSYDRKTEKSSTGRFVTMAEERSETWKHLHTLNLVTKREATSVVLAFLRLTIKYRQVRISETIYLCGDWIQRTAMRSKDA